MYTCCPHCQTCFRITKAQLDVAQGKVRCGHCKQVFNGKEHLQESISPSEPEPSPPVSQATTAVVPPSVPETEPEAVSPSEPATEEDLTDGTDIDFDLFDLSSIPDSEAEEEDWLEEEDDLSGDFQVMESDEWLEDDEFEDDVTANLDADDEEYEEDEEEELLLPEDDILTEEPVAEAPKSRYEYVDFEEEQMPEEQQDIDQFIAEVNAQLSEAIEEPTKVDPFRLEKDRDEIAKSEPIIPAPISKVKEEKEETEEPMGPRTDDEFKQAFLANLDSDLQLEPTSPGAAAEQSAPTPIPPEPVFPPPAEPAKTEESKPDIGPVDDILSAAKQRNQKPSQTAEVPFHLRDSLVVEEEKRNPIKLVLSILAILIISAVLVGQLAYFRSSQLVDKFPAMQPMVEKLCTAVPCIYSGPRDVSQIKLLSRDVRLHHKVDNALLISATFINRASFKQPYPDITISLSDLSGAMVAQRRFTPAEYLGRLNSPFLLMPSGKPVHIELEVIDPGKDAVNFEFTFQ